MTEPNAMQRFQRFIDQAQRFAWSPTISYGNGPARSMTEDEAEIAREHVEAVPPDSDGRRTRWGYDPSEEGQYYLADDIFIDERGGIFIDGAPFPFHTSYGNQAKVIRHEWDDNEGFAEVTVTLVAHQGIVDMRPLTPQDEGIES